MKWLIVNGDDLRITRGINRGMIQAHCEGILTSTSLMVERPAAEDAAALARECPGLSVGLHLELDPGSPERVQGEIARQLDRFRALCDAAPTHVDSHHDIHQNERLLPHILAWARSAGIPLRGHARPRR